MTRKVLTKRARQQHQNKVQVKQSGPRQKERSLMTELSEQCSQRLINQVKTSGHSLIHSPDFTFQTSQSNGHGTRLPRSLLLLWLPPSLPSNVFLSKIRPRCTWVDDCYKVCLLIGFLTLIVSSWIWRVTLLDMRIWVIHTPYGMVEFFAAFKVFDIPLKITKGKLTHFLWPMANDKYP